MSVSLPPFSTPQQDGDSHDVIARLREELEATTDDAPRGLLLYEAGVFEQHARNDAQAVRDLLAAVNALPDFLEPLERLVAIIERRKSYKNLGKLLDRLCKIAATPEEASRAQWMRAAFLEDQAQDVDAARASLEEALRSDPSDPTAWLFLELLAAHTTDEELRQRALASRADLAMHPEWKALLLTDLAAMIAERDVDGAVKALERAMALKSPATLSAVDTMTEIGRRFGRDDIAARALEATAALVLRSTQDPSVGDALGVPTLRRNAAHAADAWLRAAEAHRRRGDFESATKLLAQARSQLPTESALSRAALRLAEATGDTDAAAALAREELSRGVKGPSAAALWLRVAEAAASGSDALGALDALSRALVEDPGSIPARALQLDLLTATGDSPGLARALEEAARFVSTSPAKARLDLARADVLAREARDVAAARDALAEAAALDPGAAATAARVGRALASVAGDTAWHREATQRLLDTNAGSEEGAGLAAELLREASLRSDASATEAALRRLERSEAGSWIARSLRAFGQARTTDHADVAAMAQSSSNPQRAHALRLLAAFRARASGDLESADGYLTAATNEHPDYVLVASMLSSVRRARGDLVGASRALADCAERLTDDDLALAWTIEAGILSWQAGERATAVSLFSRAAEVNPDGAGAVLAWALRAAQPDDLASRRKALDAMTGPEEQAVAILEDLGLDLASGVDVSRALERLERRAADLPGTMTNVPPLAKAILGATPEERRQALLALSGQGGDCAAIVAAAAHTAALSDRDGKDPARLDQTARAWAMADTGAAAALEWLVVGIREQGAETQALAMRALVGCLDGDSAAAIAASAEIIRLLTGGSPRLVSREEAPARLADLETSPPGTDPARRAYALERTARVLDDDTAELARILVGYNALAAGNLDRAIAEFDAYTALHPEDLAGWEGLFEASERAGALEPLAKACAALGDATTDDSIAAEYWERAAQLLADLGDVARGELALERAVARDIRRFSSFDKLFRIVRARKDGERLLELIAARLDVAEDPIEIAKLFWERARVLRQKGDHAGSLEALENVVMLEPDHVGALALRGEIFITEQRFEEAAGELARLAALREAPQQQRLMSGIAAADIYENKLADLKRSLKVLITLDRDGLSTPTVRERLARSAARAEAWEEASEALENLATERDTREGRVEAARLAMAICRDRLSAPRRAKKAVELLLAELPDDGEALDLVLEGGFPEAGARRWLERGRDATARALIANPGDVERAKRLAELGRALDEPGLRQVALGIRVAAGDRDRATEEELATLDARTVHTPRIPIDDSIIALIRDPEDAGPIADLFRELAPALAEALGPNLNALGVQRRDRIKSKDAAPVRDDVAAWATAMGMGEFEFYVGGRDPDGIYGIPGEVLTIVCGEGVRSPLGAGHRAALARELLGLRLGSSVLRHRDPADAPAIVAAILSIAGLETSEPAYAMQSEFQRQLTKEMSRKLRKQLPELVSPIASQGPDPIEWVRAATCTLDRMAAIAVGDPSWALVSAAADRGRVLATEDGRRRASRLLSFVLSPTFAQLRTRLGFVSS